MVGPIIMSAFGVTIIIMLVLRYVKIIPIVNGFWQKVDSILPISKKWWFQFILLLIAVGMSGSYGLQTEADKYGISSTEMADLKAKASQQKVSVDDYLSGVKKSKELKFQSPEEYFSALKLGIQDPVEYSYAKRLGRSAEEWKQDKAAMAKNGISLEQYVTSVEKEISEKKAEAERVEAKNKERSVRLDEYQSQCRQYEVAKNECAIAGNIGKCMDIKLPMHPAYENSCMLAELEIRDMAKSKKSE